MIGPALLLVLGAGLPAVARLSAAASVVWTLAAQSRLVSAASQMPAGSEVRARWKDGAMRILRNGGADTNAATEETASAR